MERSSLKQSGVARRRRGFPALGVGPVPTPTEARFRHMGVLRFVLGTSALCRVWRVSRPGRDAVSARTAPDTALGDRPPFDGGRTRAVPSACLPFLWFENQRFSSLREIEDFPLAVRTLRVLTTLPDYVRQAARIRRILATSRKTRGVFRTTTVGRLARRWGWIASCRHPIPCCRGRGTVSIV